MKKKSIIALTLFLISVLLFGIGFFLIFTYGDTFKNESISVMLVLTVTCFILAILLLGCIFGMFLFSLAKTAYPEKKALLDERQILITGKGAEHGLTAVALAALTMGIWEAFELPQFAQQSTLLILGVLLGFLVYGVYRIWHGAYFALNGNQKASTKLLGIYTILSLALTVSDLTDGKFTEDGLLTPSCGVPAAFLMGLSWLITIGLKTMKDRKEEEE